MQVALLKELGADAKLGTLIEGESLLNDGTAVVVFQMFLPLLKLGNRGVFADLYSANEVVQFALKVIFGGVAIGLAFGITAVYLLQMVFN